MESYLPPFYAYPFKGQVHYVLSRSMVEYILNSQVANAIYNWSLTTVISDEIFFSTLNSNFHLKAPGSNAGQKITVLRNKFSCTDTSVRI